MRDERSAPLFEAEILGNPATGIMSYSIASSNPADVLCTVYDLSGRIIRSERLELDGGSLSGQMNLDGCPPGLLFVVFQSDEERCVRKLTLLE